MSNDKLADAIDGLLRLSGTVGQETVDYLIEVLRTANTGISVTVKGDVNGQLEVTNQIIKVASNQIDMPDNMLQSLNEVLDTLRGHVKSV